MSKKTPSPPRPMPAYPSSGGSWRFDEAAWAYLPAAAPRALAVETPVEAPVEPSGKDIPK